MNWNFTIKRYTLISMTIIVIVALIPLFFSLPFRDNIYLSWDGAFRMYRGLQPFKDFGMPLGYAYWLLPTLSFHLFGPYLFSLVKIQVIINIVSGVSFMTIISRFCRDKGLIVAAIFLYVISFSFYNFWPWYNHTVIVFEFVSFALLLKVLTGNDQNFGIGLALIVLSAFFCFLSFFTKQDGGAFALFICGLLLIYYSWQSKNWIPLMTFGISYLLIALLFIFPLLKFEFGYWFNYGQSPHYSRINLLDFMTAIFGGSHFLKLYLLFILVVLVMKSREGFNWLKDRKFSLHLILTLGIWIQAAVLQVTSYVPADGNIYYHSFMFFFILTHLKLPVHFNKASHFLVLILLISFWWSGLYWKYASRMFSNLFESSTPSENVVSSSTYVRTKDTELVDMSIWTLSKYDAFKGIKLPPEAIEAMYKMEKWYHKQPYKPKVLNMSELTPLATVLGYELESGIPLWYHLNVGMFDRELQMFKSRIENNQYDMVLFENIPHLNNFYPFAVRESLIKHYDLYLSFQAPREMTSEIIEVYIKKDEKNGIVQLD